LWRRRRVEGAKAPGRDFGTVNALTVRRRHDA
jgi:hypothetical protein